MAGIKVTLNCDKCKQETLHWDNRSTKKANQPDYKCIDCGKGIWINQKNNPTPKPVQKTASKPSKNGGDSMGKKVSSSFYGRWATDLAIASVEKKLPLDTLIDTFAIALDKLSAIINNDTKDISQEQSSDEEDLVIKKEVVNQEEDTQEVDTVNLDDLDI